MIKELQQIIKLQREELKQADEREIELRMEIDMLEQQLQRVKKQLEKEKEKNKSASESIARDESKNKIVIQKRKSYLEFVRRCKKAKRK